MRSWTKRIIKPFLIILLTRKMRIICYRRNLRPIVSIKSSEVSPLISISLPFIVIHISLNIYTEILWFSCFFPAPQLIGSITILQPYDPLSTQTNDQKVRGSLNFQAIWALEYKEQHELCQTLNKWMKSELFNCHKRKFHFIA